MLSEKQLEAVQETAAELDRRRQQKPAAEQPQSPFKDEGDNADRAWARDNLRIEDGRPILDIANVLRVLERHEAFKGRFMFNETLGKVLDKGVVMLDWRISECCADIQERFMPNVSEQAVKSALVICANKTGVRK